MKDPDLVFLTKEELVEVAEDCEKIFRRKKTYVFPREFFRLLNSGARIVILDKPLRISYYQELEYEGHKFITITPERDYNPELN